MLLYPVEHRTSIKGNFSFLACHLKRWDEIGEKNEFFLFNNFLSWSWKWCCIFFLLNVGFLFEENLSGWGLNDLWLLQMPLVELKKDFFLMGDIAKNNPHVQQIVRLIIVVFFLTILLNNLLKLLAYEYIKTKLKKGTRRNM